MDVTPAHAGHQVLAAAVTSALEGSFELDPYDEGWRMDRAEEHATVACIIELVTVALIAAAVEPGGTPPLVALDRAALQLLRAADGPL